MKIYKKKVSTFFLKINGFRVKPEINDNECFSNIMFKFKRQKFLFFLSVKEQNGLKHSKKMQKPNSRNEQISTKECKTRECSTCY